MELIKLITRETLKVPLRSTDKRAVIEELLDFLIDKGDVDPALRGDALAALMEREYSMSTGMENGVALPHATVDFIDTVACVLGVHPEGVKFESSDKSAARLIVLMLVPKNTFTMHVKALAGIARLMNDEKLREHLKKASSPKEAVNIIAMHTSD